MSLFDSLQRLIKTVIKKFRLHGMRNSNRNWHSGMPLAASIIYLYTRKIHGRAHTFSLSTIHETSCLLWPFDQQYFCMKQEQSCVPLDQQAYSELMRSGHRKHVSFGRLALPSINLMHLSISQNGRWPARARPTAHLLFFPSPYRKGLAAKSTGLGGGCRPQPGVICTLFPKKNQPARLPFFFSGCCCRECSRSDVIQFLNMCYVKMYQVWPDLYKKILMFIILNKYY